MALLAYQVIKYLWFQRLWYMYILMVSINSNDMQNVVVVIQLTKHINNLTVLHWQGSDLAHHRLK